MPRRHGRKIPSVQGHQFSVTTQPVDSGKASTFFSDIHWGERNNEEFTRYTCSRAFMTP